MRSIRDLSMSFERVDQPWIRARDQDVPYALVFWTQEDEGVRTPPEIPAPESNMTSPADVIERVEKLVIDALNWEPSETGESYAAIRQRLRSGIQSALATTEGQP